MLVISSGTGIASAKILLQSLVGLVILLHHGCGNVDGRDSVGGEGCGTGDQGGEKSCNQQDNDHDGTKTAAKSALVQDEYIVSFIDYMTNDERRKVIETVFENISSNIREDIY